VITAIPLHESSDSSFDRRGRFETDIANQIIDVSIRRGDVARLHREEVFLRRLAEAFFERLDEVQQLDRLVVADVVDLVRSLAGRRIGMIAAPIGVAGRDVVGDSDDPFDDVVHKGEVAAHLPVIEDVDRLAGEDRFRKQEQRRPHGP